MQLERIITLANTVVELQFRVMERSLRGTGCKLPLLVIPYDDRRFDLPEGAEWAEDQQLFDWLEQNNAWPACRKYLCFQKANYLFVDTDIVFLKNPEQVFAPLKGFITSCRHWSDHSHTTTPESKATLSQLSTTWEKTCFNSGQWGCDRSLFEDTPSFIRYVEGRSEVGTLLSDTQQWKDQAGINLIVNLQDVPIHNLTLPPYNMESTWAGDYKHPDYADRYWKDEARKPFLIHWAGVSYHKDYAINELPRNYLKPDEVDTFFSHTARKPSPKKRLKQIARSVLKNRED